MTALLDDYDTDAAALRAESAADALRAEAERKVQFRARRKRDKLVARVGVLDGLASGYTEALKSARPNIAEVAGFFDIDHGPLQTLLRHWHEEFVSDGWQPGTLFAPQVDSWTDRAMIRAALLLEDGESEAADEIKYLLDQRDLPLAYSARGHRIAECSALFEDAMSLVGAVHGDASAEVVWRHLQDMPRYDLQALVVALAAMVPDDAEGIGSYLREISGRNGGVAHGLTLLIPRPSRLFQRRRKPGRLRYIDEPGGVSVTAQR